MVVLLTKELVAVCFNKGARILILIGIDKLKITQKNVTVLTLAKNNKLWVFMK